jgi:hypothetical protein
LKLPGPCGDSALTECWRRPLERAPQPQFARWHRGSGPCVVGAAKDRPRPGRRHTGHRPCRQEGHGADSARGLRVGAAWGARAQARHRMRQHAHWHRPDLPSSSRCCDGSPPALSRTAGPLPFPAAFPLETAAVACWLLALASASIILGASVFKSCDH